MTTTPQTRALHRAGGIHVFHRPGTTPWTLVVFGPRQPIVTEDRWWGSSLGRQEGVDLIGVATTDPDWFPRDLMETVLPAIRAAARPDLVTYGFDMGGYGALKYAAGLGARGALGFSPHFSIDPADGTTGEIGAAHFDPRRHAGMRIAPGDYPDGALVLWDPGVGADDRQARAIAALPGIRAVKLRLAGHMTALLLPEARQLLPVCEHLIAGRTEEAVAAIRLARRQSPTVLLAAAAMLEAHGHPHWAAATQQRALARRVDPVRALRARADALARTARPEAEIAALRGWIEAAPQDPEPRLRLVERLGRINLLAEAVAAARDALAAGIADDRLPGMLEETGGALTAAPAREERPAPRLLGESDSLRLWFWPGEGPASLVVFTPASAAPVEPEGWWFRGQVAPLGWSTLVFAAHRPTWYPGAEMAALLPQALAALPRGPRITFGAGMGGYAALKYGRAMSAKASIAFAPVFSLDPVAVPRDPRTARQFDAERNADMTVRRADLARLPVIVYDPLVPHDRAQARRLAAMPRILAVPLRRGGSGVASVLAETGRLGPLLHAALAEDGPGVVAVLREARLRSPGLRRAVAMAAEARGHAGWAAALRGKAPVKPAPSGPPPAPPPVVADRHFAVQANTLRAQRRYDAEAALLRRWIAAIPAAARPRVALAQCLQRLGQVPAAALALFDAIRDGVRDEAIGAALIGLLPRLECTEAMSAAAASALAAAPADAAMLALSGEIALWAGQPADAERRFLAALAQEPAQRGAALGLAMLEPDPAPDQAAGPYLAALLSGLAEHPATETEWHAVIDRLSQGGRLQAAVLVGQAALDQHPGGARLVRRMARALVAVGRGEEAILHHRRLIDAQPQQAASWTGMLDALSQLRRHEQGRAVAAEALALHPTDAALAVRHANFLLALDQGAAAEREARRAIALDPSSEGGYLALMDVLRRQERRRDALAVARAGLEALPEAVSIAQRLARMLAEREDYAGAAEIYERLIAMMAHPPQAVWVGLAEVLQAAGRPEEAEAAVRRGLEADPAAQDLRGMLGQMLLSRGEAEAVRSALAQAIDEDAESSAVNFAMAEALLRQGRKREALALLEATAAAAPDHVPTLVRLGQLMLEAGRVPEAGELFTRLTEADPGLAIAWVGLSDAERLRKRIKPALAAYRAAMAAGVDPQTLRALRYRLFGEYDG
ncbi:tetratricopeptide repeat protein [Roseomonas sp. HJA6]|uniref:Tetratricopeptide repeat protein n=1 Tax=Roseomonas alba TaxID=2846776 RepID=A0ABS7A2F3_9PROT|nr:tetratricopeptide repeat protein [Neoroseomonas alba]MBW6396464.1 tetratricopeptide repeat protein [Neoroseomonas alba]